ncbi:unnamed protein product [Dovyalis caffra]|uniref:Uncharacterized protein n=1 Tax=Dovyalis caffra TaxID=77055 RepID=A0AAV1RDK5_9ROSI|nr:unnamed protein product [Dovyalis caffra]
MEQWVLLDKQRRDDSIQDTMQNQRDIDCLRYQLNHLCRSCIWGFSDFNAPPRDD